MAERTWVFVLGTGRCGSTLVQEVLARHRGAGFVSNLDDLNARLQLPGRAPGTVYRRLPPSLSRKGRMRYAPSEAYRALAREVSPMFVTPMRDLVAADVTPWMAQRLRGFFDRHAESQDAPVFMHKFTGWPRSGYLQEVFPGARFINVVRDGRAVANSWLQMPWWLGYQGPDHWQWGPLPEAYKEEWERSGRSFTLLAGLLWKLLIDSFEQARDRVDGGRWLDLRYEDVVSRPRESFDDLLRFCGLEPDADFHSQLDRYTFSSGRSEAFRRDLGDAQVGELTDSLRDHLLRWGYTA